MSYRSSLLLPYQFMTAVPATPLKQMDYSDAEDEYSLLLHQWQDQIKVSPHACILLSHMGLPFTWAEKAHLCLFQLSKLINTIPTLVFNGEMSPAVSNSTLLLSLTSWGDNVHCTTHNIHWFTTWTSSPAWFNTSQHWSGACRQPRGDRPQMTGWSCRQPPRWLLVWDACICWQQPSQVQQLRTQAELARTHCPMEIDGSHKVACSTTHFAVGLAASEQPTTNIASNRLTSSHGLSGHSIPTESLQVTHTWKESLLPVVVPRFITHKKTMPDLLIKPIPSLLSFAIKQKIAVVACSLLKRNNVITYWNNFVATAGNSIENGPGKEHG